MRKLNRILGPLLAIVLWEVVGRSMGDALFAPFSVVVRELYTMLLDGRTLIELARSLQQMLIGLGLACIVGMPLGVLMGRSRIADVLLHPWLSMFIVTSVAALVPLLILLLGTGLWFRVAVVFIAAVWYITLTTYQGARGIDPGLIDVGRSFDAGPLQRFWKIVLPALYPFLLTGLRIGLVHAIRAMVVAEMFVIVGFGGLIHSAGLAVSSAPLLALLTILMLVGVTANALLKAGARRAAPWYSARISGDLQKAAG
jgi:ABC-type nitrate/sulfonate/bicarbonate transport system permease component